MTDLPLAYRMHVEFDDFLKMYEGTPQTLEELIKFNDEHRDLEFTESSCKA